MYKGHYSLKNQELRITNQEKAPKPFGLGLVVQRNIYLQELIHVAICIASNLSLKATLPEVYSTIGCT